MSEPFEFVSMAAHIIGPLELVLILVIVIILFGADKLANLGGALGKGIREFRQATKDIDEEEGEDQSQNAAPSTSASEPEAEQPPAQSEQQDS